MIRLITFSIVLYSLKHTELWKWELNVNLQRNLNIITEKYSIRFFKMSKIYASCLLNSCMVQNIRLKMFSPEVLIIRPNTTNRSSAIVLYYTLQHAFSHHQIDVGYTKRNIKGQRNLFIVYLHLLMIWAWLSRQSWVASSCCVFLNKVHLIEEIHNRMMSPKMFSCSCTNCSIV